MRIAFAEQEDTENLVQMGARMMALSRFSAMPCRHDKLRRTIEHAIANPGYMLALARSGDESLAGFHLASMQEYFFADGWYAQSISFFVAPEYRGSSAALRLLRALQKWGERQGAREIVAGTGVSDGTTLARMDRFMRHAGLRQVGGLYSRVLG